MEWTRLLSTKRQRQNRYKSQKYGDADLRSEFEKDYHRIFLVYQYAFSYILTQRFCQRRDFHGMGQSRTDKITFIQWKYLRLILKSPK